MISNALCFGNDYPASGAPCCVQVGEAALTITLESTGAEGAREAVSFATLRVSAGGLDHDHLVVQWSGAQGERTLYLKDADVIRAFRQAAPDHLSLPFAQAAELVRQVRHRRRLAWSLAVGALLSTVLGVWLWSDLLVELAVSRIPVEWEQKLGEAAYRDFLTQQEVLKEGLAVTALGEMTQRLTEQILHNPYKFDVTVVKSDVINAFALPGGHVVVFTGLMKKADSGEEVAGVMSHELNHVLQRHGLERIVKSLGLLTVVTIVLGDQQGLAGMMKQFSVELLTLKFGREQETEADVTGLQLLQRAKIDPSGMIKFFERLSEKDEGRMEWLSTHPMSTARAERLKAKLAALPKKSSEPFTFDWKQVQASLGSQSVVAP